MMKLAMSRALKEDSEGGEEDKESVILSDGDGTIVLEEKVSVAAAVAAALASATGPKEKLRQNWHSLLCNLIMYYVLFIYVAN